jgi:hypothetical protein
MAAALRIGEAGVDDRCRGRSKALAAPTGGHSVSLPKRTLITKTISGLLSIGFLALPGCVTQPHAVSEEQACNLVKARVVAVHRYSEHQLAFCDPSINSDNPPGYFVLALHSNRQCDGICSTNLGWFAVRRSTGEVFDWDVTESKLEGPVRD